ncbi:MAG: DUF4293 family protein [Saprospiraceae bacterium]
MALDTIFLFNNRNRQKSVTRVETVFNLIGIVLAVVVFMQDSVMDSGITPEDGIGLYTPIVGFVLILLAVRTIGKDEKTVRSMDRFVSS